MINNRIHEQMDKKDKILLIALLSRKLDKYTLLVELDSEQLRTA
jgi:hypothetical protein